MTVQFLIWFLTLFTALISIWFKDYLDVRKVKKLNKNQQAIKAYMLLSRLMCSLSGKQLVCQKLIEDKNFNYVSLMETNPDETSNLLEELEIVTIENFYELSDTVFEHRRIIIGRNLTLLGIITGSIIMTSTDFQKLTDDYDIEICTLTNSLKQAFSEKYVNNQANFWTILDETKLFLSRFFGKPK